MTASALLLSLAAAWAAPGPADPARLAAAGRAIDRSDTLAVSTLDAFERSGTLDDARRALASAGDARDRLEALSVPAALAGARREELIFLNHAVPGLAAYLADPANEGARKRLDSVLRRGRAHRERSRRALRAALGRDAGRPAR